MRAVSDNDPSALRANTLATWKTLLGAVCLAPIGLMLLSALSPTNPGNAPVMIGASMVFLLPVWFLMISIVVTLNYIYRPKLVLGSTLLKRFIIRRWIADAAVEPTEETA